MTGQYAFLTKLVAQLEQAGIEYMLAGSVGSSLHGHPRATQDVDIVITPTQEQLYVFLASLGETIYVSPDAAYQALQHYTMFNVIDMESGWKADLIIRKTRAFSREEFDRRQSLDLSNHQFWVVSPEDVILSKLEWVKEGESEVQYADALGVAVVNYHSLDLDYLKKWAAEIGVSEALDRLLSEAQENISKR